MTADIILHRGRFTTLDRTNSNASAVAVTGAKFIAVGDDAEIMIHFGPDTNIRNTGAAAGRYPLA